MHSLGLNLYSNFPSNYKGTKNNTKYAYQNKVRALIMGHCGNGKSHFINNMCNTNLGMGIKAGSYTRDIDYKSCQFFPQNQFLLFDTPGTNSKQDAITHALILRRTISCLPTNLIIIQAKFQQRYKESTLTELRRQSRIFKNYSNYVLFVVSHLDTVDNPQYASKKQQILQQFFSELQKCKFTQKVIFYSNMNSNFQTLSNIIYNIGIQNFPIKIKIDDETFFKYFKLQCDLQFEEDEIRECVDKINNVADCYLDYLRSLPYNLQDADNLISQLKIYLKQDLKNTQNQDYKIYYDKMGHQKSTDLYLMISQIIQSKLQQFDQLSLPKLNRKFFYDYSNKQLDVRDLYKQCPNPDCGLIWMRAYGCDGSTNCGNKPEVYDFFQKIKLFKFRFIRRLGQIFCEKAQKQKIDQNKVKQNYKKIQKQAQKNNIKTEKIGCGTPMIWIQLPRLPNIEQILKQIESVHNFAQLAVDYKKMETENKDYTKNIQKNVQKNTKKVQESLKL